MNQQRGAVLLLMVNALLMSALFMTLGSYKTLFFQIKQTNNYIKSQQEYWRAEGGLECAYALVNVTQNLSTARGLLESQCRQPLSLHQLVIDDDLTVLSQPNAQHALILQKQLLPPIQPAKQVEGESLVQDARAFYWREGSWFDRMP